jgi:uncharacterized protein YcbX
VLARLVRYPVKSMRGEELSQARLTERGIEGDRRWALIDQESGRVVSAKYPRKWGRMLTLSASSNGTGVAITFPDGNEVRCGDGAADQALSTFFRRSVHLSRDAPDEVIVERVDPVVNGELVVDRPDRPVTTGRLAQGSPPGTFFDYAPLHLVTIATLNRLHDLAPGSRFDVARFRPNLVLDLPGVEPFAENGWCGALLRVGTDVVLRLGLPAPRCAIPTLAQPSLPHDNDVIRTIARHNRIPVDGLSPSACVGCYADVVQEGVIHTGDPVCLESRSAQGA